MTETVHITLYEDELQRIEEKYYVEKEYDGGCIVCTPVGMYFHADNRVAIGKLDIESLRDDREVTWSQVIDEYTTISITYGGERQNDTSATDMSVSISLDVDASGAADELRRVADAFNDAADSLEEI